MNFSLILLSSSPGDHPGETVPWGKNLAVKLVAVLFLGLLVAPASAGTKSPARTEKANTDAKIRLRIIGLPDPEATEPTAVAALRVSEEFLRRYPKIELHYSARHRGSVGQIGHLAKR